MAQEIGRVERPFAEQYRGKRKFLLVPLMHSPPAESEDGSAILEKYWEQVSTQTAALQSSLGSLRRVYCESLPHGGPEGLQQLEQADPHSHGLVQKACDSGAVLEPTENVEILKEIVDLQRFLMLPLASEKVALRVQEWYGESTKSRYEHIANQIDTTLQEDETGLLLISERHQVQFPPDIEVFYVAPPALDAFRRWLQNWADQRQQRPGGPDETEEAQPQNETTGDQAEE